MSTKVKVKPPYIGLLNAIAVGEERGGQLFEAWASTTKDKKLRRCLSLVAAREHDHARLFCERLGELGFAVRPAKPDPGFERRLAVLGSAVSDRKKLAAYEDRTPGATAPASAPPQLDPVTKALYDWFIAEERDSGRILRAAFDEIRPKKGQTKDEPPAEDDCVKLFRGIAAAEKVGGRVLAAWAGATKDPELREVLALVAGREAEHARVFRGRLEELGIDVEDRESKKVEKLVAFYASNKSDAAKAAKAMPAVAGDLSGLDALEASAKKRFGTIEAHLISWFVGEERDSAAKLRAAYTCAMEAAPA
jgi:rubrerythrin